MQRLQKEAKSGRLKRGKELTLELVFEDGSLHAQQGQLLLSDLAVADDERIIQQYGHRHLRAPAIATLLPRPEPVARSGKSALDVPNRTPSPELSWRVCALTPHLD